MNDVHVQVMDLPTSMHAYTKYNAVDDCYTIILNARSSYARRIRAYQHELQHICCDDFHKNFVQDIENETHQKTDL